MDDVEIRDDLLSKIEERTDSLDDRDEWIADAIRRYLQRDDPPDLGGLDRSERRARLVEDAIRAKLD